MAILKGFAVVAALLIAGTSLAMAQNGPATGGEHPVAGGATGGPRGHFYHPRTGHRIHYLYHPITGHRMHYRPHNQY